jgi:hypothetical protein
VVGQSAGLRNQQSSSRQLLNPASTNRANTTLSGPHLPIQGHWRVDIWAHDAAVKVLKINTHAWACRGSNCQGLGSMAGIMTSAPGLNMPSPSDNTAAATHVVTAVTAATQACYGTAAATHVVTAHPASYMRVRGVFESRSGQNRCACACSCLPASICLATTACLASTACQW